MPLHADYQYSYSPLPHSHIFLAQSPAVTSLLTLSHGDQDNYSYIHTEGWSSSHAVDVCHSLKMCFPNVFVFLYSVFVFIPNGPVRPPTGSVCLPDKPVCSPNWIRVSSY